METIRRHPPVIIISRDSWGQVDAAIGCRRYRFYGVGLVEQERVVWMIRKGANARARQLLEASASSIYRMGSCGTEEELVKRAAWREEEACAGGSR
jgi:hypothetical protein